MKTISIKQPYASQIAFGLKLIEFRSWNTAFRGQFLIHATGKAMMLPADKNTPLLSDIEGDKYQLTDKLQNGWKRNDKGHLPEYATEWESYKLCEAYYLRTEDLLCAASAIIGAAELVSVDGEPGNYRWNLANPRLFDEPLRYVKGRLNWWDFQLSEDYQRQLV